MSFRANQAQQLSFDDSVFFGLTERERKALDNSWAYVFAHEIFPAIDENRFSVLYSDSASRPNTAVNVIVGALIIKELFDYTDDELVEGLMLDVRLQYALHTTSNYEQPLSDKTLSRFRKRCYEYERQTGIDLWRDCIKDLSAKIAKMMGIDRRVRRMDSMMVESNIRILSRSELIFECMSKVCRYTQRNYPSLLPEHLLIYADPDEFNRVFYHTKDESLDVRIARILSDADELAYVLGDKLIHNNNYQLFLRSLIEQTIVDVSGDGSTVRRLRTQKDGMPGSHMLQNPSDPDATYRVKAGKKHRGYAANIEESVGERGSVITNYQYDVNTKSDSEFLHEALEEETEPVTEPAQKEAALVTDGAYDGKNNVALAASKGIDLVVTALLGNNPPDVLADFEWSEDGKVLLRCACGNCPKTCYFTQVTEQVKVTFDAALCEKCMYKDQCNPRIQGDKAAFTTSLNATRRAKYKRRMGQEDFQYYARLRNGIETIPSILRKNYRLDKLPRGKIRSKLFFGAKIAALNFQKLIGFITKKGRYAPNPLLS